MMKARVRIKRGERKQGGDRCRVVGVAARLENGLAALFASREHTLLVKPELFHSGGDKLRRKAGGEIGRGEAVMEFVELFRFQWRTAPDLAKEGGIADRPAAEHQPGNGRKLRRDLVRIPRSENIAVIDDGEGTVQSGGEGAAVGETAVHALPIPRVNGEAGEGILAVDGEDRGKLRCAVQAEAGLDRDPDGRAAEDLLQTAVETPEVCQHPGTLVLGDHGPGRAADIQVDLPITHSRQLLRHSEEGRGGIAQKLRDQRDTAIVFRQNVTEVPGLEAPGAVRRDERRIVSVGPREQFGVDTAVYTVCDALHGRKAELHREPPNSFLLYYTGLMGKRKEDSFRIDMIS